MKYIIGNWKMNPLSVEDAVHMASDVDRGAEGVDDVYVGLAVPSLFLSNVKSQMLHTALGAQNVFWENGTGAYTGEVSPRQLMDLGVEFVILGHSERRIYMKESDQLISQKADTALDAGLTVILCVGEPSDVRDKDVKEAKKYVKNQLSENLSSAFENDLLSDDNLIVAYEPVWAISTFEDSKPAAPEDAESMIRFIKEYLSESLQVEDPSVIYGGSTDAENVKSFLDQPSVDGALPGSASLDPEEFVEMVKQASKNASDSAV